MATADDQKAPSVAPTPAENPPAAESTAPTSVDGASQPVAEAASEAVVASDPAAVAAANALLLSRLDLSLVALVIVFAFVLALFPVRNSDFLQQLAVGRLVAHGEYRFGADPFTAAGDKTGWVNHSWLFGLLSYSIYQLPSIGPATVVVLKALLMAGLAGLMLLLAHRPGQRWYVPAILVALAVLALSARMLLQSVVASYFFLGLTLWLLDRPRRLREQGGPVDAAPVSWWLLPVVFAAWVNLDQWFFLGPLTTALYLAGELIQKDKDSRVGMLGAVLGAGLLACVLNPFHVHAFALPAQLSFSDGMEALKDEGIFRAIGIKPLERLYYAETRLGFNPAGIAYYVLAILGAASFGMTWGAVPWWRLTVWLGLLLLSLLHARAIPFFAVVAGPIASLNFVDYMAMQTDAPPDQGRRYRLLVCVRVLALVFAVAFILTGALGFLHPKEDRRLGTGVVIDPLLEQAAEKLGRRQKDTMGEALVCFNMSPEIVHYLSWFSPGVRGFMDARLPQFPEAARDYVKARRALVAEQDNSVPGFTVNVEPAYHAVFRDWGVGCLLWHEQDPISPDRVVVLQRFLAKPEEWPPLEITGRTLALRWHDPQNGTPAPSPSLAQQLEREAFGPGAQPLPARDEMNEASAEPAWWSTLLQGDSPRSPHTGAAAGYLALFEASGPMYQYRAAHAWEALNRASLVAGAGTGAGVVGNGTLNRVHIQYLFGQQLFNQLLNRNDGGPPAALYLALRAARRALLDNPGDARAHLILGEAYFNLAHRTRETVLGSPYLMTLRTAQATTCFQQALALNLASKSDQERAHLRLAALLGRQQFQDMSLNHFGAVAQLVRDSGNAPAKADEMEKEVEQNRTNLKSVQDRYELESANRHPIEKAQMALRFGLAEKALEQLQSFLQEEQRKGSVTQGTVIATNMAINVLFASGRVGEARELLNSPAKSRLGAHSDLQVPAYNWYMLMFNGILGDATEVDHYATEIEEQTVGSLRVQILFSLGQYFLSEALSAGVTPYNTDHLVIHPRLPFPLNSRFLPAEVVQMQRSVLDKQISFPLLRAELFLESGELGKARKELERPLAISTGPEPAKGQPRVPSDRRAFELTRTYLSWLDGK